jgi:hypothetical protein
MQTAFRRPRFVAASVAAACLVIAAPAMADERAAQGATAPTTSQRPDFLFGRPRASLGLRGGWVFSRAGSDIFDFVTRHLTLEKQDFNAPGFAADVGIAFGDRVDVQFGFEMSRVSRPSEYRDFVDNRLQPIEQTTSLSSTLIAGGVRYALRPKGEAISRLAWIPNRVVPYVGAGAGVMRYDFRQHGDFVDFEDFGVFGDTFRANGWTPTAHVYGGVDLQLYRALYGAVQGRYLIAKGTLGDDFVGFDPIDLSGVRLSAGISVLF